MVIFRGMWKNDFKRRQFTQSLRYFRNGHEKNYIDKWFFDLRLYIVVYKRKKTMKVLHCILLPINVILVHWKSFYDKLVPLYLQNWKNLKTEEFCKCYKLLNDKCYNLDSKSSYTSGRHLFSLLLLVYLEFSLIVFWTEK